MLVMDVTFGYVTAELSVKSNGIAGGMSRFTEPMFRDT